MAVTVVVSIEVPGFHQWLQAPKDVDFLLHPHRHDFRFVAHILVGHDDRAVEFYQVQNRMIVWLDKVYPKTKYGYDFGQSSCEHLARSMARGLGIRKCEVWEDQYNGAIVVRDQEDV